MPVPETKPRLPLTGTCPVPGKMQLFLARSALRSFQGREGPAAPIFRLRNGPRDSIYLPK